MLASDVEMYTVEGFELSSWERGYDDFELVPDLSTLRLSPWREAAAFCLADVGHGEHPVAVSPRAIRQGVEGAGMAVENSKGECNLDQQEIACRYGDAMATANDHVLYKTGAKEIAAQRDMAITLMAKYDGAEGNSCHVHLSLRCGRGSALLSRPATLRILPRRPDRLPEGLLTALRSERQLLHFNAANVELDAFGSAVTDWEFLRGLERL